MTDSLFREGGPLNTRKTGADEYRMSITLPTDARGHVARECPSESCAPGYFKVRKDQQGITARRPPDGGRGSLTIEKPGGAVCRLDRRGRSGDRRPCGRPSRCRECRTRECGRSRAPGRRRWAEDDAQSSAHGALLQDPAHGPSEVTEADNYQLM